MNTKEKIPTIHMLCGFICSGKTTFAQKLERELEAVTFCPDMWMALLFGTKHSDQEGICYAPKVDALISRTYEQLLKLKIDIILDSGFWTKAERDRMKRHASELGAKSKLYFLTCPKDVLLQRLQKRNAERKPDTIMISEAKFKIAWEHFHAPGEDEEFELIETSTHQEQYSRSLRSG
jgi:predicted kinase